MTVRSRFLTYVVLTLAIVVCHWVFFPPLVMAGPQSQAARELAELVVRKFSKQAARETAEKLAPRIEAAVLRHGDDALVAVRKAGPRGLRALEEAGEHADAAAMLLAREGERALWIVENPGRLRLLASGGDEAAAAMLKHKGLAEPLLKSSGKSAARAFNALDGRNARRLAMMAESGELARVGRTEALLNTVGRYGNRGMEFIWKNKKALAVGAALTAFLANPEPFIDGTAKLARDVVRPVAESIGTEAARRTNWTWLGVTTVGVIGLYAGLRLWLQKRMRNISRA